jgi:hypothetical protein
MQSSKEHTVGIASSGLRLRLLAAVATLLWSVLVPSGAVYAERAPGYADSSPAQSTGWSTDAQAASAVGAGSAASTGTVVVNLNPSSSSVAKDAVFTVDIQIVAGAQQVDGAEIHLFFSQTYLQVVDSGGNPSNTIEDLSGWNALLANQVYTDTEPARILFAAGILGSGTKPSGTFSLARIRFKALWGTGGGSTPLVFGTTGLYKTEIYNGVTSVLGGVANGSVTISGQTQPGTATPTLTPSHTPTATSTKTTTPPPTPTATLTSTPSATPTATTTAPPTPTRTLTSTPTATTTATSTATPSPTPQSTVEVCLQEGWEPDSSYSGASDTYLHAWYPAEVHGGDGFLRLRQDNAMRPVIKFNLSPYIPSGLSTLIVDARLSMLLTYANSAVDLYGDLYRLNRSWDELNATWSSPWSTAGADAIPADREGVVASTALLPAESGNWVQWDVTGLVQDWVAGRAANHGVIMISRGDISREVAFASSDYAEPATFRPKLCVKYFILPATPTVTPTPTDTSTPTRTPTRTVTHTPTGTSTPTSTVTATVSPTPTNSPTWRYTPTLTRTSTITPTPTRTQTATITPTATVSPTPTETQTPTPTDTPLPYDIPITLVFQHGGPPISYYGVTDTYLDPADETRNFGQDWILKLDHLGNEKVLLRFDLARYIPADAVITRAKLEVYFHLSDDQHPGVATQVGVYEVYQPWVEDEATWVQLATGYPWDGCRTSAERSQVAAAMTLVDAVGWKAWESEGMAALVQHWVSDPAANQGMALLASPGQESQLWEAFSSQAPQTASRPKLQVVFYRRAPSPTETRTPTHTATVTPTATQTSTSVATATHTATPIYTPTASLTSLYTPTATLTSTRTATRTPTATPSHTATRTLTPTPTLTATSQMRRVFLPLVIRWW